jgi:hypothetical protein
VGECHAFLLLSTRRIALAVTRKCRRRGIVIARLPKIANFGFISETAFGQRNSVLWRRRLATLSPALLARWHDGTPAMWQTRSPRRHLQISNAASTKNASDVRWRPDRIIAATGSTVSNRTSFALCRHGTPRASVISGGCASLNRHVRSQRRVLPGWISTNLGSL